MIPTRPGTDAAVRFLFRQVPGGRPLMQAEVAAGLGHDTIRSWRYGADPGVRNLRRALNAIGFDLAIVDRATGEVVR